MRIAIIGNPGSGKSTLGRRLHQMLNIPLHHLDQYFWKPGWQRPDREFFAQVHHDLCDSDAWIIEGMATRLFDYRAARADILIFLDTPLWLCFFRIFKRASRDFGKVRESSAQGCPERFPDREFLSYVWNFNRQHKPLITELLHGYLTEKMIFVIRNKNDYDELIIKLTLLKAEGNPREHTD